MVLCPFGNKVVSHISGAFDKGITARVHSWERDIPDVEAYSHRSGVITGAGILFDCSPIAILIAFKASAAVLMLVFKDTILRTCSRSAAYSQQDAAERRLDYLPESRCQR